jgi:hypothetical protein
MPESILVLSVRERAERYRAHAEEALTVANRTTDHKIRGQMLLIAQGWNDLAGIAERTLLDRHMRLIK